MCHTGLLTACELLANPCDIPLLCLQWKTPDDGQRKCPKHAEFYSKNNFEKLVYLVGFIIRIYHDTRHLNLQRLKLSCVWRQQFKILCNTGLTLCHHIWYEKLLSVFQKKAWKPFIMLPRETGNRLSSEFGWPVIYILTRQRIGIPENSFWMWRHITNRNLLSARKLLPSSIG